MDICLQKSVSIQPKTGHISSRKQNFATLCYMYPWCRIARPLPEDQTYRRATRRKRAISPISSGAPADLLLRFLAYNDEFLVALLKD